MHNERTDYERLTDSAVLLSLWAEAQKRIGEEAVGDRLKLMKLAFLATYQLFWDDVKALNLRFYRYMKGPYTQQVADSWADLSQRGMLAEAEFFVVTDEGMRFAESFTEEVLHLKENKHIYDVLESVADEYAELSTEQILKRVYEMWCFTLDSPGRKREVDKIARGRVFTTILDEDQAQESLVIPPGWQMTLELAFHPYALRNLQRGIDDTHANRLYGLEALGADI